MVGRKSCQQSPKYSRLPAAIQREMAENPRVSHSLTHAPVSGKGSEASARRPKYFYSEKLCGNQGDRMTSAASVKRWSRRA